MTRWQTVTLSFEVQPWVKHSHDLCGIRALNFLTQDDGSMYSGKLQADGYAGYNVVSEAVRIACLAHIPRKFVDALKLVPSNARSDSVAAEIIEMIGELYAVERFGKGLTDDALLALRARDSRPLVARIKSWLKEHRDKVLPQTALGNAIRYGLGQWSAMKKYLDDGRCSIDSNIADRDIKRVVMGRKAWLFADSVDGMEANAVLYSPVQTCIANQVDPYMYFKAVIERMPYAKSQTDLKALLPWALKQEFEHDAAESSWLPSIAPTGLAHLCRTSTWRADRCVAGFRITGRALDMGDGRCPRLLPADHSHS